MSAMKGLLVLSVVLALAVPACLAFSQEKKDEMKAKLTPIMAQCGSENGGITFEYLKEFKAQKKQPDDSISCFFACVFKKIGMIDDKGLFSTKVALEKTEKYAEEGELEKIKQAISNCESVNQKDVSDGEKGCDRAKYLYSCWAEQKENFGFAF